jgi:hypothetical protein
MATGSQKAPQKRSRNSSKKPVREPAKQPSRRPREIVAAWSTAKKIVAGVVAICAGLTTVVGAIKLGAEAYAWYQNSQDEPSAFSRTPNLGLQIWQHGKQVPMSDEAHSSGRNVVSINMLADPFEIWFPTSSSEGDGLRVCAWRDDSVFSLRSEMPMDSTRFFYLGSGMAMADYANGLIWQSLEAHNYFVENRIEPAGVDGYSKVYLSRIGPPGPPEEAVSLSDGTVEHLYLVALIDHDRDRIVDFNDYEYLSLSFE